ncbi:bifunctional glycosyltransferase/CDP-glycerol:glycerophosphate glycerophosphotransferase [Paeniglutamicibacter antarcticus]|uniref:Glycosyltransferase 2-like domain-containing protein n=1 Tax=Paeniglutamicibacter antarcticus TaxID=494023 RepID=A0ABP9TJ97_9MICC
MGGSESIVEINERPELERLPVQGPIRGTRPDITVVIAVYNDSHNLITSIESAQYQTHNNVEIIVVDDCSTDDSHEKALELASSDSRIRVLQTPRNSGGVGAPRNVGRRAALAEWITFLDSDDELDVHACKNLINAAKGSNADVIAGKTKRFHVATGRWSGWHARLYSDPLLIEGIESFPELAIDTIAVGKLFSKQFLDDNNIYCPEDIHYEDLVFTAQIYKKSNLIKIICESTYVWKIYPVVERKSITNQRDSIKNVEYRLEALARIKSIMSDGASPALADRLQLKILRHDARLYLNDIAKHDDGLSEEILRLLRPQIAEIQNHVISKLDDQEKILYLAALSGIPSRVRWALRMIRGMVSAPPSISPFSERNNFSANGETTSHVDESIPTEFLNIPFSNYIEIPWFKYAFYHEVTKFKRINKYIYRIHGQTNDQFEHLSDLKNFDMNIVVFSRSGDRTRKLARVNVLGWHAGNLTWEADVLIPEALPHQGNLKLGFMVQVARDSLHVTGHLFVATKIPNRKSLIVRQNYGARLSREAFYIYRTVDTTAGLRQRKVSDKRTVIRSMYHSISHVCKQTLGRFSAETQVRSRYLAPISRLFRSFVLREGCVLFESHMGKSYSDSPKAISLALAKARPDLKQIWSFAPGFDHALSCAHETVVRGSLGYLRALATSKYLVDNQSWPSYFRKRSGQTYLQTWHGVPLKLMGYDMPTMKSASPDKRVAFKRTIDAWDYLCNPSPFFEETFVKSVGYRGELLPYGSPRNDELVSSAKQELCLEAIRTQLGIRTNRKVVLYAPTFRASNSGSKRPLSLNLDLQEWVEALGSDTLLLVRPHYLNKLTIPMKFSHNIIDVSNVDNISELYLIADILITDYSSVMFDYSILNKPIILYAYDLESYVRDERGTYFDITEFAPGRIVKSQHELAHAISEALVSDVAPEQRVLFQERFMGAETGHASEDAITRVWGEK